MLNRLRRLADFTLVELTLLFQLIVLSLGLRVALSAMPLHRLISCVSHATTFPLSCRIPLFHLRYPTDRLVELSELAATVSHGTGHCLPRSLLLFWLLRARHRSVTVCLGVNKNTTVLQGHAWVELDGAVVGDTVPFIRRYTPILRLPT